MIEIKAASRLCAESAPEYVRRLKKMGIKKIGEGAAGVVFQHPSKPNVVVKLQLARDKGYEEWVKFCQKNPNNPYLPKIFKVVKKPKSFDGSGLKDLHLVFMEKLTPLSPKDYTAFGKHCKRLAEIRPVEDTDWSYFKYPEMFALNDFWLDVSRCGEDANLAKVAKFLHQKSGKYMLDLHRQNIMKRGNDVVLADPFAD